MHGHNHSPRGPTAGHQRGLPSVLTPLQLSSSEPRPPKSPLVHIFSSICLFPRVSTLEHLIHLPPLSLSFSFSLWITLTLKHHFVRFVLSSSVSPGTSCLSFHLNLAARHLFKPAPNVGSICPVWPLPRCIVRPFFTPPPPPICPPPASLFPCVAMLERMSRRSRSWLSLTLTTLALALSILALCTSYWCEGTHKVVKPLCLSPVQMKNCGQNNSEPDTTGRCPIVFELSTSFVQLYCLFLLRLP